MAASSQTCYPGAVTNLHHAVRYSFQMVGAGAATLTYGVGASKVVASKGYAATGTHTLVFRNAGTFVGARVSVSGTSAVVGLSDAITGDCSWDSATKTLTVQFYNLAATPAAAEVASGDLVWVEAEFVDSPNGT